MSVHKNGCNPFQCYVYLDFCEECTKVFVDQPLPQSYSQLTEGSFPYPLISDPNRELAVQLGMVDPDEKDKAGLPLTCRAVSTCTFRSATVNYMHGFICIAQVVGGKCLYCYSRPAPLLPRSSSSPLTRGSSCLSSTQPAPVGTSSESLDIGL